MKGKKSISRRSKGIKKGFPILPIAALGAGLLLTAAHLDSKHRIETQEIHLRSHRLPPSFDGFTIAQLSDLHGASFGRNNTGLLSKIESQYPDIIVLTGDFVDKKEDLASFEVLLRELKKIAPVVFVAGNHDWRGGYMGDIKLLLEDYGIKHLSNDYMVLGFDDSDDKLILAGAEDPNGSSERPSALINRLREEYPEEYVLLLGHRNYWLERYPLLDVDAILCGHGHGGIIRLPGLGGVFGTDMTFFPEDADVISRGKRYDVITSRGLGDAVKIPRMFNNAHLPIVVLNSEE